MPKKKQPVPVGTCHKIMRDVLISSGLKTFEFRIADAAAEELGRILFDDARILTLRAFQMAKYAKRKTIDSEDIKIVRRMG